MGDPESEEDDKPELDIMMALVHDTQFTVEEAVSRLTKVTLAATMYKGQLEDHCYCTARALLKAAAVTGPQEQSKLIRLLHRLRRTTINSASSNAPLKDDDKVVWTGLPTFGYTFADELSSIPDVSNGSPEQRQRWENTIAFFAQLDASSKDPELDFTKSWATAYIHAALDGTPSPDTREITIRLACIWYIYDADKLWSKITSGRAGDVTREKWESWEKQLWGMTEEDFDDGSTHGLIEKALGEIQRVSQA